MYKEKLVRAIYNFDIEGIKKVLNQISDEELNDYEEYDETVLHDICRIKVNYFTEDDDLEIVFTMYSLLIDRLIPDTINKIISPNHCCGSALSIALNAKTLNIKLIESLFEKSSYEVLTSSAVKKSFASLLLGKK